MGNLKGFLLSALFIVLLLKSSHAAETDTDPTQASDLCETDEKKAAFRQCFDRLKQDMTSRPLQQDGNWFLCMEPNKGRLDCVIKALQECPSYIEAKDVKEFKDRTVNGMRAKHLLYLASADEFCKCAPTYGCLESIEIDRLAEAHGGSPWKKVANMDYICGRGRNYIQCVAHSLPVCSRYLQYRYNMTSAAYMMDYYDVNVLKSAEMFGEANCRNFPEVVNISCSLQSSNWTSVELCYENALAYEEDVDKHCGLHKCVEKVMSSCPSGTMQFFIDSVNVFGEYKVPREPCPEVSSSPPLLSALTSILLAICASLFL